MIKKWHLFAIVTLLFIATFVIINQKYDRFYRVEGINNDNRALIERYLDDKEQDYLVEQRIPVSEFIDFIKVDNFELRNYEYYNILSDSKRYTSHKKIVHYGNLLSDKIKKDYPTKQLDHAKTIVDYRLERSYLQSDQFNIDHIEYYEVLSSVYTGNKLVKNAEICYEGYHNRHIEKAQALEELKAIVKNYTKKQIKVLLTKMSDPAVMIVTNPNSGQVIVNSKRFIGSYEPKSLVLAEDLLRFEYDMYVTSSTYKALLSMKKAMGPLGDSLLLTEGFTDYNTLLKVNKKVAGFTEFQLGTSVDLTLNQYNYNEFKNTKLSKWLEKNAYKYGFILRYPVKKASQTGKEYNAHIYRYVGKKRAKVMHDENLCLEEYVRRQEQ